MRCQLKKARLDGSQYRTVRGGRKARRNPGEQLITHRPIGVEPLLAMPLDVSRIRRRPVFDSGGDAMRHLERLVMRLGRKCHNQVKIEPVLEVLKLLEGHRLAGPGVGARLTARGGGEETKQ